MVGDSLMQNYNTIPFDQGIMGPRQKGLIDQLAGGTAVSLPPVQAEPNAPTAAPQGLADAIGGVKATAPAQDFSRLVGYDAGKFNDPNKKSAKYQIGHTLAGFDPTQGITPDVVNALNGLGLGTFSGSGDKLNLSGLTDAGRQAGLTGNYTGADFIQGFKSGNGKWGYSDPFAEAAAGGGQPVRGGGNAAANIGLALGNLGNQGAQSSLLQQIIASLRGQ